MNATFDEHATLAGGPLDGSIVPVQASQSCFTFTAGDRVHYYIRICGTCRFTHVDCKKSLTAEEAISSFFPDHDEKRESWLRSVVSMRWLHRLRSKMG